VLVHIHRADGDDALTARARRAELGQLGLPGCRPAREGVDDDVRAPALDEATGRQQLLSLAVQMLSVADRCMLVRAGVSDGHLVAGPQEQADRDRADEVGPADEGDAHRAILAARSCPDSNRVGIDAPGAETATAASSRL